MRSLEKTSPLKSSFWSNESNFSLVVSSIFLLLGFIGILHHEMWRDELQAWMTARDSVSLAGLAAAVKYQGHPLLWYLGLYAITRFTHNPLAMQLLHILIATATVWVFVRFSPFTKLQKLLFAFGFFPFYEYAIISRGYALGILFFFIFCAFYKERLKKPLLLSCFLFLLCQTSVLGLIIAISLEAMLVFDLVSARRQQLSKTTLALMLAVFFSGVIVSIWQIIPPQDSGYATGWHLLFNHFRLERISGLLSLTYFCSPHYWLFELSSGAQQKVGLFFSACLSGLLFIYASIVFLRKPKILCLYACGTLALLAFFYFKYEGYAWHHGHLYILLIACFWLSAGYPDSAPGSAFFDKLSAMGKKYLVLFVGALLTVHFYQGARAYARDYVYPFSAAKETAQFIKEHGLKEVLIAGDPDYAVSPIAGYLDKKIYYLREGKFATYVQWDNKRLKAYDLNKLWEEPALRKKKFLLVVNQELKAPPYPAEKIGEFTEEMARGEQYWLYAVNFEN